MEPQLSAAPHSAAESLRLEAHLGAHSDVGRVRGNNEDRLLVYDLRARRKLAADGAASLEVQSPGVMLIVADGMGGMLAGERASQMCVDTLPAALLARLEKKSADRETRRKALRDAVHETHQKILAAAQADNQLKGMGTTCTVAVLDGHELCIAHVGDSRAYLGRHGEVTQLTRDQTVWESMQDGSQNPAADFGNAPWKNMLMQALGAQPELNAVITETTLDAEEWLLLCTDGLHRVVKPEDMAAALWNAAAPAEKAKQLIALANERGGPDNSSVILCQVTAKAG